MSILLFLMFGLIIGLLARAFMPGEQRMGVPMTIALGVAGSFVGGFLVNLVSHRGVTEFHMSGFIGSLIGSLVLLGVARMIWGQRAVV